MSDFNYLIKEIWSGKSVTRSYLNLRLTKETLMGVTIDIGGGRNADYLSFMGRSEDVTFETFDMKAGQTEIDFETDILPAEEGTYDTVLFLNVMEHIFNHQHIADEVVRIVKPGGQLIGFVPFLMWYHADHRDFFRYTHEALENIFTTAGAKDIKIEVTGGGPFIAASHMVLQSFPKILRIPVFLTLKALDSLYSLLKGEGVREYALGYFFKLTKS